MAERKTGAGAHLSGVLERSTPHRPLDVATEADDIETPPELAEADIDASPILKSRGSARTAPPAVPKKRERKHKKEEARTIYLPDPLFERIMIQARRRRKTISEYVATVLNRHVPDPRTGRSDSAEAGAA